MASFDDMGFEDLAVTSSTEDVVDYPTDDLVDSTTLDRCVQVYNRQYDQTVVSLRPLQARVVKSVLQGHDTIAMLPTGYGKPVVYELLPTAVRVLNQKRSLVLVVVPLDAILTQQFEKLGSACMVLRHDNLSEVRQRLQTIDFLICHPEHIVNNKDIITLFSNLPPEHRTSMVVEEAHCILHWGEDFRTSFSKLACLRILLPSATVVALSATLSNISQQAVASTLGMRNHQCFLEPPARDSIFLSVQPRPVSTKTVVCITPLLQELLEREMHSP